MDVYVSRMIDPDGRTRYCFEEVPPHRRRALVKATLHEVALKLAEIARAEWRVKVDTRIHFRPRGDIMELTHSNVPWRCYPLERSEADAFWESYKSVRAANPPPANPPQLAPA